MINWRVPFGLVLMNLEEMSVGETVVLVVCVGFVQRGL